MKRALSFVAIAIGTLGLYAACGDDQPGITNPGPDGSADGATTTDGGVVGDGAASGDAPATTDGGGGGAFTDAPPTAVTDGGGSDDAGPGGDTSKIACGSATCSLASAFCCVYRNQNPPPEFLYGCATGSGCPVQPAADKDPTALACSGASNCPASTVCCVKDDGTKVFSECSTTCADTANVKTAQLCDRAAAASGCPAAAPCSPDKIDDWRLPNGYATCGGKGN